MLQLTDISEMDRRQLEIATRGQSQNKAWLKERCKRLTASNFGRICKATSKTNFAALAMSLVNPRPFTSKTVVHGTKYESVAIEKFEKANGVKTSVCGLFVDKTDPWMGASPDAIVNSNSIVEVKCSFSAKDKDITPTTVPYLEEIGSNLQLKVTHDYFYQVQGQLMCTDAKICYFNVFTLKDFKTIQIPRNDEFICQMRRSLNEFYQSYFKDAAVEKHVFKLYNQYF